MATIARSSRTSSGVRSARSRSAASRCAIGVSVLLERGPQAAAGPAGFGEPDELVGVGAVERARQDRQQRLLVVRVGEHAQPREPVADLLLGPVAAAADDVGRQALLLERLLEQPQRGGGADEHDDVPGAAAGVDLGAQPVGDQARLAAAPRLVAAAGQADRGRPSRACRVISSSTGGAPAGGSSANSRSAPSASIGGSWRPARSGEKRSPNSGANAALMTSSSSSRERKLVVSVRTASSALARPRKIVTSAWRKR